MVMKVRKVTLVIYKQSKLIKNPETGVSTPSDSVLYESYRFSYPETKIDFKISSTEKKDPSACLFKIYGVSKDTYSLFKPSKTGDYENTQYVYIYHGYDDNQDLVYSGILNRVIYAFDNGSQTITGLLGQDSNKVVNQSKSISLSRKTTLSEVLDLIGNKYGYYIKKGEGIEDSMVGSRFTYVGDVIGCLDALLPKEYSYTIKINNIYVYKTSMSFFTEITLYPENGLLSFPTEDSKGEKVAIKSILIPKIDTGFIVKIPIDGDFYSKTDTGKYRKFSVLKYSTAFTSGKGITEMECEEIDK